MRIFEDRKLLSLVVIIGTILSPWSMAIEKQTSAPVLTRSYRLELENEIPEGLLLVEQRFAGEPAYTVSYFVGPRTTKTQVLLKSYFDQYVSEMKRAMPLVESWNSSQIIRCRQLVRFSSIESGMVHSKKICLDALSNKTKAQISDSYASLKSGVFGAVVK